MKRVTVDAVRILKDEKVSIHTRVKRVTDKLAALEQALQFQSTPA